MTTTQEKHRISKGVRVAELIRQAILDGDLIAGQRLVEADLIEQLYASRGAVRSAFDMLLTEGLIEKMQHRGVRIRSLSLNEALEVIQIRALIESECVAQATGVATEAQRSALRSIGSAMKDSVKNGDWTHYSSLNKELHSSILEMSGNLISQEIIQQLRVRQARFSTKLAQQYGRPETSLPEHIRIIEAVCSGDVEQARQAMFSHLASVREATREHFKDL